MDGLIIGWAGVGLLAVANVSTVAFFIGRLSQKVDSLTKLLNDHLHEHGHERHDGV